MNLRFLQSRGMQKFRRDRAAVVASLVIGVYLLMAILVGVFGLIDQDDTKVRVLPNRYPGFLERPSEEDRIGFARWWWEGHFKPTLETLDRTSDADARRLLDERLGLAERRMLGGREQTLAGGARLRERWEALETQLVLREELSDELVAIEVLLDRASAGGSEERGLLEERSQYAQEHAATSAALLGSLEAFEAEVSEFQPIPGGWDGALYRLRTFLGSDSKGSSIAAQATYSIKIAFQVGFVTSLVSVILGSLLGAAAAYFAGWVDHLIMWLVSTLSSIPYLVLLTVIAYMFTGTRFATAENPGLALVPVYVAFCAVFWISTCRVVRGEVLKIKELEYVQAATAVGFSRMYILVRHVLPNTAHLMFINFSLLFIGAIKSEVILSFLGLGVKGQSSWGVMINLGRDGVTSFFFWEVGVATFFMFFLVLAFNILSDALQDAFDPKHVG